MSGRTSVPLYRAWGARDPVWDGVAYDSRWHYQCLVEVCVGRYDGVMPLRAAQRCSDVDDPQRCLDELAAVGLLKVDWTTVTVLRVDQHVPPPHLRDENIKPRQARNSADYRRRRCERGEHSRYCPPTTCPAKQARVTARVTNDTGTGRDYPGNPLRRRTTKGPPNERRGDAMTKRLPPGQRAPRGERRCAWHDAVTRPRPRVNDAGEGSPWTSPPSGPATRWGAVRWFDMLTDLAEDELQWQTARLRVAMRGRRLVELGVPVAVVARALKISVRSWYRRRAELAGLLDDEAGELANTAASVAAADQDAAEAREDIE